jgi:uncharacterized membrane protein
MDNLYITKMQKMLYSEHDYSRIVEDKLKLKQNSKPIFNKTALGIIFFLCVGTTIFFVAELRRNQITGYEFQQRFLAGLYVWVNVYLIFTALEAVRLFNGTCVKKTVKKLWSIILKGFIVLDAISLFILPVLIVL